MDIGAAVAKRIVGICKDRQISINKLATQCHITQSTLNNIVNGGSKKPTVDTVWRICRGLDITLSQFFDDPCFHVDPPEALH